MRKPMITRTITTTKATLMVADTMAGEILNMEVTLPRTYKNDEAIIKAARPIVESEELKVVSVVHVEITEALYGMTEADFIAHAELMPEKPAKTSETSEPNKTNETKD